MSAERQRRTTRSARATSSARPKRAEPLEAELDEELDDELREEELDEDLDEDLVEVRIAVGPDGIAEALTLPSDEEDEFAPFIERDEKLEQEIEWEASQPLEQVIEDWDDPTFSSDPVRMYLHEIGRTALLTAEDEITLATAIREGKEAARRLQEEPDLDEETRQTLRQIQQRGRQAEQRLTQANLRLVVSVAKRYL
ncbi:MAG: hypothetical protein N2439_07470, partial [Anaerolineae bacterium]|nr:hypothetical protein [Anaerolineae bacterium]